jgi:hypothetical protein
LSAKVGKTGLGCGLPLLCPLALFANESQLAGVQPVATALGALVYLDAPERAEEMAHHHDVPAFGTIPAPFMVDFHTGLRANVHQHIAGELVGVVELLQFEVIEPDAAATADADIHHDSAGFDRGQFVCADWTFHDFPRRV